MVCWRQFYRSSESNADERHGVFQCLAESQFFVTVAIKRWSQPVSQFIFTRENL